MKTIKLGDAVIADEHDDTNEGELARLNEALARGLEAIKVGRFRPAREVIADLQRRYSRVAHVAAADGELYEVNER